MEHPREFGRARSTGPPVLGWTAEGRPYVVSTLESTAVSIQFQTQTTSGPARLGRLTTPHSAIETPVFMPVGTVASVKGLPQDLLEELGVQILLARRR